MRIALAAVALALVGCSSARSHEHSLTLHVHGPVTRASQGRCLFSLRAAVREGGVQRTCLTTIAGFPAPNVTMHSRGLMTFALARGVVTARVRVTQRFGADGAHAQQTTSGVILRGRGDFAGVHGSISGSGDVVDTRSGLRIGHLVYRLAYTR